MERRHALDAARNVLSSKVGKVVLDENKFPERTLEIELKRIESDFRKTQTICDNDRKMFKKDRLIYNMMPMILLERSASPGKLPYKPENSEQQTAHYMTGFHKDEPHITIDIPTIDAFAVKGKRKFNLWENPEDTSTRFRSIIMQSPPLDTQELDTVQKGWATFRPVSKDEELAQQKLKEKKLARRELLQMTKRYESPENMFITQLDALQAGSRLSRRSGADGGLTRTSEAKGKVTKKPFEMNFDHHHLETFEEIRKKQIDKFNRTIRF